MIFKPKSRYRTDKIRRTGESCCYIVYDWEGISRVWPTSRPPFVTYVSVVVRTFTGPRSGHLKVLKQRNVKLTPEGNESSSTPILDQTDPLEDWSIYFYAEGVGRRGNPRVQGYSCSALRGHISFLMFHSVKNPLVRSIGGSLIKIVSDKIYSIIIP